MCVRDSLSRGEAPIASHLLFLDDTDAGPFEMSVVYTDRGISKGMEYGIAAAMEAGLEVEFRTIL